MSAPGLYDPGGAELCRLDLSDPEVHATRELAGTWRMLRDSAPVAWQRLPDGRGFWVLTDFVDCQSMLVNHETFTSRNGNMLATLGSRDPAGGRQMLASDPPYHTMLRLPLQQVVSSVALRRWTPRIRRFIRTALRDACEATVWDVGPTMAALPMKVAELIMGLSLDEETSRRIVHWSTTAMAPDDPEYALAPDRSDTLRQAHGGIFRFFTEEIERRRRYPSAGDGDLIDQLLTLRIDGRRMSVADLVVNCYSLLLGANITTGHASTATIAHLAGHPELYARWSAEPSLLRSGVEEAIRWSSPVLHVLRYATSATTVRQVPIARGDAVSAWLVSANHDEKAFPRPDCLDPARKPNQHIAFGAGPHYCIGAVTARITLRIVFEEIFRLVHSFEPAGESTRLHSTFVNGIKHCPVIAHPR